MTEAPAVDAPAAPIAPARDPLEDLARDPDREGCHIGVGRVHRTRFRGRIKRLDYSRATLCGLPWVETGQHPGGYYFYDAFGPGSCPECGGPVCPTCYARRPR